MSMDESYVDALLLTHIMQQKYPDLPHDAQRDRKLRLLFFLEDSASVKSYTSKI